MTNTTTTPAVQQWLSIRCGDCQTVLFRERVGTGLLSFRRRKRSIIVVGVPVLLRCACGWTWRNPDVTYVFDDADLTEEIIPLSQQDP